MNSLDSYINNEIKPIKHTDSIAEAQDVFADFPYTHFPVTEDGIYIGCISKEAVEFLNPDAIINDSRFHFERFFSFCSYKNSFNNVLLIYWIKI